MYLFDLDGTLIDSNGIWAEVDRTFLARHGLAYTKEYYEGVAHTILPLAAVFTKAHFNLPESCEEIVQEWMTLAEGLYSDVKLKPFTIEFLQALQSRGERMAVFTSSVPEHCRCAMEKHGLDAYFERVIFAQELGLDKSDPECFRRAAQVLGTAPEECVLLDDSVKSCRSGKAVGMYVIGVYDPFFESTKGDMPLVCDRFIHSFAELL